MPSGGTLHIEEIQDQVELQLMRSEELEELKATYYIERKEHKKEKKKHQRLIYLIHQI